MEERRANTDTNPEISDVLKLIPAEEVYDIIQHQNELGDVEQVVLAPYPDTFQETHAKNAHLLEKNRSVYDDVIEEEIAKDGLLQAMLKQRRKQTNNQELINAIRIRRTVIAARLLLQTEQTETLESLNTTPPSTRAVNRPRSKRRTKSTA